MSEAPRISVRALAASRLGKRGALSLRRDVLGVHGLDNPRPRSLRRRLDLLRTRPSLRLAVVQVRGSRARVQRDLDTTQEILERECGLWLDCSAFVVVDRPHLLLLDQESCPLGEQPRPTDEELELFSLGRDLGADLVAYYIRGVPGFAGCSSYPAGRRGFWVGDGASPWTFAHELLHVVGRNFHVSDSDNLMSIPTSAITHPPPDVEPEQCERVRADAAVREPAP